MGKEHTKDPRERGGEGERKRGRKREETKTGRENLLGWV